METLKNHIKPMGREDGMRYAGVFNEIGRPTPRIAVDIPILADVIIGEDDGGIAVSINFDCIGVGMEKKFSSVREAYEFAKTIPVPIDMDFLNKHGFSLFG